jgi:hypothetical protein
MTDPASVEDALRVVLRGENGEIKHAQDVKGPNPEVWGDDSERPDPFATAGETGMPLGEVHYDDFADSNLDELRKLASERGVSGVSKSARPEVIEALHKAGVGVVKGPGEEWERNEKGEYVNR